MAYKFQLGAARLSGSLVQEGQAEVDALTADSLNVQSGGITNAGSIAGATSIDGSGDLTMGTITMTGFTVDADGDMTAKSIVIPDDATIGAVGDTDMITLDAGNDVTFASDLNVVMGDGKLVLNATAVTSTAAELNLLDGSAADTIVNSKAVIYGSSGEVNASQFDLGGQTVIDSAGTFQGNKGDFGQLSASVGLLVSGSGGASLITNGSVRFDANLDETISLANDALYFKDQNDNGNLKVDTVADIMALVAGNGLAAASGVLSVGVDDSTIELNSDALRIKNTGVTAAKLNDNIISGQDELAHADIVDADELMISDGGVIKRVGVDSIRDHFFGVVSGDATVADGGALTIAADAVESGMLNDNIISGQTALTTGLALTDEFLVSDAGSIKRMDVSVLAEAIDGAGLSNNAGLLDVDAAQTGISSILHNDLKLGRADGNDAIDFGTDDQIDFFIDGTTAADLEMRIASGSVTVYGNLNVQGTTTTIDSANILVTGSISFEGATANDFETTLGVIDPTADRAINLANVAGTLIPFAAASTTAISATPAEVNLLDGDTSVGGSITLAAGDGFIVNDNGTMKTIPASDIKTFVGSGVSPVTPIDNGETLAVGVNYFDNAHGGAESVNLPASAGLSAGESIKIKVSSDCSSTNSVTINRAGSQTIDGATSIVLESPNAAVELVYVAADLFKIF